MIGKDHHRQHLEGKDGLSLIERTLRKATTAIRGRRDPDRCKMKKGRFNYRLRIWNRTRWRTGVCRSWYKLGYDWEAHRAAPGMCCEMPDTWSRGANPSG